MSVCYWAIDGYGLKMDDVVHLLDVGKLASWTLGKEGLEEYNKKIKGAITNAGRLRELECILQDDVFFSVASSTQYLAYASTDMNEDGEYLYYPSKLPWEISEEEKEIKKEDIDNMIIETIKPFLKDDSEETVNKVILHIDTINTGGEG